MKTTAFIAGLVCGVALSAVATTPLIFVDLTHHDAAGRVQHAQAPANSVSQVGQVVYIDYTSDVLSCNGFELP